MLSASAARAGDADFRPPPTLERATRVEGDGVMLEGRAIVGSTVLLASPDGERREAQAGSDGRWRISVAAPVPRLFAFSANYGGRILRGEGALAAAPAPAAPALVLRSGAPSWPASEGDGVNALRLIAFDFDAGGGAAASGLAQPGQPVQLAIDGAPFGAGQADGQGRFALLAVRAALKPGRHKLTVTTPAGAASAEVDTGASTSLAGAPFRALRAQGGWRIDWAPPGGGVQSTLLFDQTALTQASAKGRGA